MSAPVLGEGTNAILSDMLGLDKKKLTELKDKGVI
jgi:crotonobetainyl-CoA:carnitine CoA-transferase CaiB-like acyl-CoA transferase